MGEISRGDPSSMKDASLGWSEEFTLVDAYLEEDPFEELCGNDVMVRDTPSIGDTDPTCTRPLNSTPISSPLLPTTPLMCMHFMSP